MKRLRIGYSRLYEWHWQVYRCKIGDTTTCIAIRLGPHLIHLVDKKRVYETSGIKTDRW